jgi:hypothetical protein
MHITQEGFVYIAASVAEFNRLSQALIEDVAYFQEAARKEPTVFSLRAYTRSFFALVEGTVFGMKQTILAAWPALGVNLRIAELALLFEEGYDVKENGDPRVQTKFLRLASNLRFTVRLYAKVFEYDYTLNVQGGGWQAFNRSIGIRNRLTHPKRVEDLNISLDDMDDLEEGFTWFLESVRSLVEGAATDFAAKASKALSKEVEQAGET